MAKSPTPGLRFGLEESGFGVTILLLHIVVQELYTLTDALVIPGLQRELAR
jgi:hypothetical protein